MGGYDQDTEIHNIFPVASFYGHELEEFFTLRLVLCVLELKHGEIVEGVHHGRDIREDGDVDGHGPRVSVQSSDKHERHGDDGCEEHGGRTVPDRRGDHVAERDRAEGVHHKTQKETEELLRTVIVANHEVRYGREHSWHDNEGGYVCNDFGEIVRHDIVHLVRLLSQKYWPFTLECQVGHHIGRHKSGNTHEEHGAGEILEIFLLWPCALKECTACDKSQNNILSDSSLENKRVRLDCRCIALANGSEL